MIPPQPQPIRRIHILGMAGSGKTTLARQLAARLNAPCYELDVIGYENGSGAKRPLEQRQADVQKIGAQSSWIVEGAFLWWVDDLFAHADVIVWLDLHWRLCWWRIVLRHIKADFARNNRHPGFHNMLRFAAGVRPYYINSVPATPSAPDDDGANRAAVAQVLAAYEGKVVHCRRPADARAFLKQIT